MQILLALVVFFIFTDTATARHHHHSQAVTPLPRPRPDLELLFPKRYQRLTVEQGRTLARALFDSMPAGTDTVPSVSSRAGETPYQRAPLTFAERWP